MLGAYGACRVYKCADVLNYLRVCVGCGNFLHRPQIVAKLTMKNVKELPPVEKLREVLDYNPETGDITYKVSRGSVKAGKVAGYLDAEGYLKIRFDKKTYQAHRIAYTLHHGTPVKPTEIIDHRDGNKSNNRIVNLRIATASTNCYNRVETATRSNTGVRGVYWLEGKGYFTAWCSSTYLGKFLTLEEAIDARQTAMSGKDT